MRADRRTLSIIGIPLALIAFLIWLAGRIEQRA